MIYIIVFFIAILCTYIAERNLGKNKIIFLCFSFLAIIVPSILAGLRDSGIGTDTEIYVDRCWYEIIWARNWQDFVDIHENASLGGEWVYIFINYIASLFGKEVQWCYFFTNLVVMILVYLTAYDNRKKASMWIVMMIFLFMGFNSSLNLVRQSIALAECMYAYKYIEQRNWKFTLLWFIIIMNSHGTGIFYVLIIVLSLLQDIKRRNVQICSSLIIMISSLVFFVFYDTILLLSTSYGILPVKYLMYSTSETAAESINKGFLILYLCIFFLFVYVYWDTKNKTQLIYYTTIKGLGIITFLLMVVSKFTNRISLYFNYIADFIFVPRILMLLKKKSKFTYNIVLFLFICLICYTWYYKIILKGETETYPYKSRILGL